MRNRRHWLEQCGIAAARVIRHLLTTGGGRSTYVEAVFCWRSVCTHAAPAMVGSVSACAWRWQPLALAKKPRVRFTRLRSRLA